MGPVTDMHVIKIKKFIFLKFKIKIKKFIFLKFKIKIKKKTTEIVQVNLRNYDKTSSLTQKIKLYRTDYFHKIIVFYYFQKLPIHGSANKNKNLNWKKMII